MGAKSLFSNNADFSGMISNGTSSPALKVSHVYHQSTFEVNEGGSEASAASGI
jgi:serine protease inhibitor